MTRVQFGDRLLESRTEFVVYFHTLNAGPEDQLKHPATRHPTVQKGSITQTLAAAGNDTEGLPRTLPTERGLTALLGSPRAVMIVLPLLILLVGVTLTLIGQTALTVTSKKMAERRFVTQTSSLSLRLASALGQAEPILDELSRIAPEDQDKSSEGKEKGEATRLLGVAREMSSLLVGRAAITQAYIAYPDGRFLSAAHTVEDGARFQVTEKGRVTNFGLSRQELVVNNSQISLYDPTKRDWYRLAYEKKARIWSPPYAFYQNYRVGVTRAHPIYKDAEKTQLLAVVGVDFDVDALTKFMSAAEDRTDDVRSLVFTLGGVVLAYPEGAEKLAQLPEKEVVPTYKALGEDRVSRLIELSQRRGKFAPSGESFYYSDGGDSIFASVERVGAGGPDWYVATFSPSKSVLSELYSYRKSSLLVGSIALLFSVALSWFVARRLLQVRKVASLAQAAVAEAQAHLRDLGSYRLVSLIGEGGMGEVWRARHRLLARDAAIKLIKQDPGSSGREAEHRERFRREAQAIAGLRSRNTVALFDYGVTADGTLFYVMELLDGIDLSTLVSQYGPLPTERIRKVLIQICNSLGEAHEAGLVHRDIKPANLVLCREASEVDVVKVLDFGLVFQTSDASDREKLASRYDSQRTTRNMANPVEVTEKMQDRITQFDLQLGTPAFMSPEQALGNDLDSRSDLYSLGCVAWWLLSGKPLYRAESAMAVMVKQADSPIPELEAELKEPAPLLFLELIRKCLSKSPEGRPQSAEDLKRALQEMGPFSPDWSEQDARTWWDREMPLAKREPQLSLPPLRDAELIAPKQAI